HGHRNYTAPTPPRLSDDLLHQWCDATHRRLQPLRSRYRQTSERTLDLLSLAHTGLRQLQEASIQPRALRSICCRGMHRCRRLNAANQLLGLTYTLRTHAARLASERRSRALDEPTQHAHAVEQQRAIGRIVDGGGDNRAVDAQLAPTRHLQAARQLGHSIEQAMHGLGL